MHQNYITFIFHVHVHVQVQTFMTDARALDRYGGGSGAINYAEISCTGSETQLADCPVSYTGDKASDICFHNEDAGVMCPSGEQIITSVKIIPLNEWQCRDGMHLAKNRGNKEIPGP